MHRRTERWIYIIDMQTDEIHFLQEKQHPVLVYSQAVDSAVIQYTTTEPQTRQHDHLHTLRTHKKTRTHRCTSQNEQTSLFFIGRN